jgi:hypothetical protein
VERLFAVKPFFAKELPMTSLRRRMTEDMQVRNLSLQTQATYVQQVSFEANIKENHPTIVFTRASTTMAMKISSVAIVTIIPDLIRLSLFRP